MEDLKTLPIRPGRLALGQIITPVVILTGLEWLSLAGVAALAPGYPILFLATASLALPLNLMLVAIENLLLPLVPVPHDRLQRLRLPGDGPADAAHGREDRDRGAGHGAGQRAGALFYFVAGESWFAAIAAAWLVVAALGLAIVPLLGQAFVQFDVSESHAE